MKNTKNKNLIGFFFGGVLPLVAFAVIEDQFGIIAGIVAGMVFGLGEVAYEWLTVRQISTVTWVTNLMILCLGLISLIFNDGIWFKLQPAILEAFFAIFLWGSVALKKNILLTMAEKQGQPIPEFLHGAMKGFTIRMGFFFIIHAAIATWAAFEWSTVNWALLKGVGLTVSMVVYIIIEMVYIRLKTKR